MAKQKERAAWACPNGECQHLVRADADWSDDANPQCGRCGTQMTPCAAIDMSGWVAIVKRIAATDAELERLRAEPEDGDAVIRRLMDAAFSAWPNELVSWKREAVFKFAQDVWHAARGVQP